MPLPQHVDLANHAFNEVGELPCKVKINCTLLATNLWHSTLPFDFFHFGDRYCKITSYRGPQRNDSLEHTECERSVGLLHWRETQKSCSHVDH